MTSRTPASFQVPALRPRGVFGGRLTAVPLMSRDGAEGARPAAAVGDLEVGAGPMTRPLVAPALVLPDSGASGRLVDAAPGAVAAAGCGPLRRCPSSGVSPAGRRFREPAGDLGAVALGQTAGGDEHLSGAFGRRQPTQVFERLLTRRSDEPAGIDDENVGRGGLGLVEKPFPGQQGGHRFGVDGVLGATQGNQMEPRPARTSVFHRLPIEGHHGPEGLSADCLRDRQARMRRGCESTRGMDSLAPGRFADLSLSMRVAGSPFSLSIVGRGVTPRLTTCFFNVGRGVTPRLTTCFFNESRGVTRPLPAPRPCPPASPTEAR